MLIEVTAAEKRVVELLREIKQGTGHGSLTVEIVDRVESLFTPARKEKPPNGKIGY